MTIIPKGQEPERVKKRMETLFAKLDEAYPDKVISGLQKEHKKWAETVTELYRLLGYEDNKSFLEAYGYTYERKGGGRASNDHAAVIEELKNRYPDGSQFHKLSELQNANPDLAGKIKTLSNRSNELFGIALADYLKSIGLLLQTETKIVEKEKQYHYLVVSVEGTDELVYCVTDTRSVHENDFIEMGSWQNDDKIIGQVLETCYYAFEKDLPIPVGEMNRFVRKLSKTEIKDIEKSKVKYIYCSVRIRRTSELFYYISPFKDIGVGDVVQVAYKYYSGYYEGIVVSVENVSEKTAPQPVKKTKEIYKVIQSERKEKEKALAKLNEFADKYGTESFEKSVVPTDIMEAYEKTTYFASAVFRGLEIDVNEALKFLYPSEFNPFVYKKNVGNGIAQFKCENRKVQQIVEKFPNLKAIFFAENWREGNVYLAYSESGYSTVTKFRLIGHCDFYARGRWPLMHDPSEETFNCVDISYEAGTYFYSEEEKYVFEEKLEWEKCDYVLPNGQEKLIGMVTIESKPHQKKIIAGPNQKIKIDILGQLV